MGKGPQPRDVAGSDGGIVSGGKLEGSCGMSGPSKDVLDRSSSSHGVEECRAGRAQATA
jgi:hypothetical protein